MVLRVNFFVFKKDRDMLGSFFIPSAIRIMVEVYHNIAPFYKNVYWTLLRVVGDLVSFPSNSMLHGLSNCKAIGTGFA